MKSEDIQRLNAYGRSQTPFFFCIDFLGENLEVIPLDELQNHEVQIQFPAYGERSTSQLTTPWELQPVFPDYSSYKSAFDIAQEALTRGDSYLLNLTFSTQLKAAVDLKKIYEAAQAKYKILFRNQWVCYSPETFVQIRDNQIFTYPMKGTIEASVPDAENKILNNEKEKAEHATIVDLLRNDLSQIANNVRVERYRFITGIETHHKKLLQVSSEIVGDLETNWQQHLGEILDALLPAGSISGAPKTKTLEVIRRAENYQRGWYTGVAGVFDGDTLDSCVLIRFIEKTPKGFVYKSGGGITTKSNATDEYEELKHKVYVPIS